MVVIEMNPRVSRSSALASKATGFPIAKVAAKLAVGYTLDELLNDITGVTPASFEPTIDYVVTKIPRFTFEKFPGADPMLTTSMKSVGEAMASAAPSPRACRRRCARWRRGFPASTKSRFPAPMAGEQGRDQGGAVAPARRPPADDRPGLPPRPHRRGNPRRCTYDRWFLDRSRRSLPPRKWCAPTASPRTRPAYSASRSWASPTRGWPSWPERSPTRSRRGARLLGVAPVFKRIDTCAAEFPSRTPYMYSTYEGDGFAPAECEADPSDRDKVMILGGGPNRIGQGIEFDYCCVHAAFALSRGRASRPSWSTATRKPSPPITTPPTGSISSR